jgi:hypothetical protein
LYISIDVEFFVLSRTFVVELIIKVFDFFTFDVALRITAGTTSTLLPLLDFFGLFVRLLVFFTLGAVVLVTNKCHRDLFHELEQIHALERIAIDDVLTANVI